MALIAAKKIDEKEKIKIDINKEIYKNIQNYCEWSGIEDINHFFEESANFIFSKDKDWKDYQRSITLKKNKESV
jgi:DNA-binding transcriptional regulator GbsR (MarR family)